MASDENPVTNSDKSMSGIQLIDAILAAQFSHTCCPFQLSRGGHSHAACSIKNPWSNDTDSDLEPVLKLGVKMREVKYLGGLCVADSVLVNTFACPCGECGVEDGVMVHCPLLQYHRVPGQSDGAGIQHCLHSDSLDHGYRMVLINSLKKR